VDGPLTHQRSAPVRTAIAYFGILGERDGKGKGREGKGRERKGRERKGKEGREGKKVRAKRAQVSGRAGFPRRAGNFGEIKL
jgi:hypothetical protein